MKNAAHYFIRALKDVGVRYIFGVPSGNWTDYLEALRVTEGIDFVLVSNEASAGFMADVHWRLTGNIAACFGTFGPGACNLSTGVCGGYLDRSPMIVLADEMDDNRLTRVTQMNIDQQTLFKPITKWQIRLNPDNIKETIYTTFETACTEVPGPVYIGIPTGLGKQKAREERINLPVIREISNPSRSSLDKMEKWFQQSQKPVIAIGITALRWGVRDYILQISKKYQIPIVLTPMAKGMIPEDHPAYAGVLAHAMGNRVRETYSRADLIIGIGYDPVEINYEDWMPQVPLIHIDTVSADVDDSKVTSVCNVIGSLKTALETLLKTENHQKEWDFHSLAKRREAMFKQLSETSGKLSARSVLSILQENIPKSNIMTCDVGAHLHLIGQSWKTDSPESQLMTNGCSSMGFGIPAAIAAKLSLPHKTVVCVTGDGGFLMMAGEMATVIRLGLKIIFVVMSDSNLSLIRIKQEKKGYMGYGTELSGKPIPSPNHYFGVPVLPAYTCDEFKKAVTKSLKSKTSTIIEATIQKKDYEDLILL